MTLLSTVAIITLRDLISCSINAQYAFCHLIFKLDECQLYCWSLRYTLQEYHFLPVFITQMLYFIL